jgi:hypothetical protein
MSINTHFSQFCFGIFRLFSEVVLSSIIEVVLNATFQAAVASVLTIAEFLSSF